MVNGNATGQGCELWLSRGDLAMSDADAVVAPAREDLSARGGVNGLSLF